MLDRMAHRPSPRLPRYFPSAELADEEGLLVVGGALDPDVLLDAYRHGIFPWPIDDVSPLLWFSPDPRALIELDGLHVSRRLARTIRSGRFNATCDQAFADVMKGCATAPGRRGGTWITPTMRRAYTRLHRLGHAHSVEVWRDGELAGGVYGVAIGGLFAAESMFHRETDASKVALAALVGHLNRRGYQLLDVQQWNEHTGSMGAIEAPRAEYLRRLAVAVEAPVTFGDTLEGAVDPRP
ncbi:Leucyl/phenylalanyl-tRNA--protein transferase [Pirellulimonas nuda]|uniref:Leucyl/phenylalanyl-tRNA--protein transferase n=1 Tax=Pirellulimonas nuda TaxID=2528009 RepID=A0A518DF95_9BACT|nr:leucyl/phenylalanyl-tRNA--protein transferase [Pirellulimonas nuda]QDU90149.1 Leucyl/phenylalanyl-tRNA--protein transferase [Pirellulimonas nuda]